MNERFVSTPDLLIAGGPELVILTDYKFWAENIGALIEWCEQNEAETTGMTVVLKDKAALTAFTLRWA
jgi:hypothetical protein